MELKLAVKQLLTIKTTKAMKWLQFLYNTYLSLWKAEQNGGVIYLGVQISIMEIIL